MEKVYNPHTIEQQWYQIWEQADYFLPSGQGKPYCIMLPPPNVTGSLHMGHGFQHTLMDALIRYHRMCGNNTLWQAGIDHAGISTQMVVERQLLAEGKTRHDLGRAAFLDRVWQWKEESGGTISRQLRRMGSSIDWSRERFTMDKGLSETVREVFIRLYDEGLIYRGKRLVNWDPKFHTAISDLEVISEEEDGHLWHIRYPLAQGHGHVVIATTRPETLLGDAAVAIHPQDSRYQHLVGKELLLPLANRRIPIIVDDYVDPEFGSGCVKITPAHDFNDYAIGQRHQLPLLNIFTIDAKLNDNAPEAYRGLDRYVARRQIIKDLEAANLLEKTVAHRLKVPRGDRSGEVIEPYLTDQWFISITPLAQPAIAAVKNGDIEFVPATWNKTYFQWLHNIQDWCISRQLWWGHRIPAWYDDSGNVYVGHDEADVRKKYPIPENTKLQQDEDVLDTWFSAALWPFSTLGWPENTTELQTYYPTSVLVTGFDIIFFWVARMIMMGLKFTEKVPFKKVYITGLIRDAEGQKMSKSKGNVLDPIDVIDGIDLETLIAKRTFGLMQPAMTKRIEKATRKEFPKGISAFGTDALRFTFCALASTGRDIHFDLARVEGYRNFCNKLWNAARYVLMNTEQHDTGLFDAPCELSVPDRWILSRLQEAIQNVTEHLENFRFDLVAQTLYEFVWHEYCDWYLELSKLVLTTTHSSEALQRGTRKTLIQVLEILLRMMHPLMPFITEEIWQRVAPLAGKSGATIMLQPYPEVDKQLFDTQAVSEIEWLKNIILSVRNIRGEMNVSPAKQLTILLKKGNAVDQQYITKHQSFFQRLAKLDNITWLADHEQAPFSATALVGDLELFIPMTGLIDKQAEVTRLNREITKLQQDLTRINGKLTNSDYIHKAPAAVVGKEQQRAAEIQTAIAKLETQLTSIVAL